jgi:O-acetylhomoserine (thiol)-lyase
LTREQLEAAGIGEGLLRLSVGLESARDLERDLESAARAASLLDAIPSAAGG